MSSFSNYYNLVAEVGCNHCGDMELAEELIKKAALTGASFVKFQKRNPRELLSKDAYESPHPNPVNSYGESYGKHREFLELSLDQHKQLMEWCDKYGIKYSCSVWDITSAKEIISLNPEYIKIGSPSNNHWDMLKLIRDEYEGKIHISLGMTTLEERNNIIKVFEKTDRLNDLVLYQCTSGYPVPFENCHLTEISVLRDSYGDIVNDIGYSGHHLGTSIDSAAYALGARWFERHLTLNRSWKGTDHAASLEPEDMKELNAILMSTSKAMLPKPTDILDIELPQRDKLKWEPH